MNMFLDELHCGLAAQRRPGPRFTVCGSGAPMAVIDIYREERLEGDVVGFHGSVRMIGTISHAGKLLHCH